MRRAAKKLAQSLGVVGVAYGGYTAAVQYEASRQIRQRAHLENVCEKYAPIKVMGRFVNPFPEYRHQTLFEFGFRRITELLALKAPGEVPVDPLALAAALPIYTPDFKDHGPGNLALTWIGQSCAYAQFPGNLRVLTDPMFANYVISPRVGPQRLVPAPCTVEEIPQPHVILVSHDHQDHLDLESAVALSRKGTTWVVPEGVGKHLPSNSSVIEMSWWERIPMPNTDPRLGYEVVCTPAMHWSGRALYDSNSTLWCSFLVLRHGRPLFFHAGDSGYSPNLFKAIAKHYGTGCKVAMVPCGAYHPRWHLRAQHMAPDESLATIRDLGARKLVGVHWGTFIMSEEPFYEPPARLKSLAAAENRDNVVVPQLGRTLVFDVER